MLPEGLILATLFDILMGGLIAMGWGILFNTPRQVLYVAALLGGLGHSIRYLLLEAAGAPLVLATLAGTVFIGFIGIAFARKVDTPPVVFTMPACITMIPGLYAYHTMLGFIKMAGSDITVHDPALVSQTAQYFVITISLLFTLSIGITIGSLLFRKKTAREIRLNLLNWPFFKNK
ncbi:threonine/serine exporter family protein [Massilibacteroides sp.]|uniref:threonine/serine exporter family protein n=1 Tax=Massilibacteroides sp. TaxID=2034766 RepID=UPI002631C3B2|nr:threonine/serine exporter family protein [Massilibacteroides sp.]MDD4516270.1 threonine/serine exporter family protein [Massilibacteroides sp.]